MSANEDKKQKRHQPYFIYKSSMMEQGMDEEIISSSWLLLSATDKQYWIMLARQKDVMLQNAMSSYNML